MNRIIEQGYTLWRRMLDAVMGLVMHPPALAEPATPNDREELFRRLHTLRERRARESVRAERTLANLTDERRTAQAQADILTRTLADLEYRQFCDNLTAGAEDDRLLAQLRESAPRMLTAFLQEMDEEFSRLCRIEPTILPESRSLDLLTLKKQLTFSSDSPSITRRVRAIHAARQRAEAMCLEPLSERLIVREIEHLKRTLPAIESETCRGELATILLTP